jgi:hypothetical protein
MIGLPGDERIPESHAESEVTMISVIKKRGERDDQPPSSMGDDWFSVGLEVMSCLAFWLLTSGSERVVATVLLAMFLVSAACRRRSR